MFIGRQKQRNFSINHSGLQVVCVSDSVWVVCSHVFVCLLVIIDLCMFVFLCVFVFVYVFVCVCLCSCVCVCG